MHYPILFLTKQFIAIRLRQFYMLPVKALNVLRCLTISIYGTAIGMIFTLAMMYSGIGLTTTTAACRSSVIICFVWYALNRGSIVFFFIERAHNVRSSEIERSRDWIWIIGLLYTCLLSLGLFIASMVFSTASIKSLDECEIGIPMRWLIAMIACSTLSTILVLGLYIWLLKPAIRHRIVIQDQQDPSSVDSATRQFVGVKSGTDLECESSPLPTMITTEKPAILRLEILIKKSIYGLLLMMPTEIFNFAYFITMGSMESGWVCFLICTVDGML